MMTISAEPIISQRYKTNGLMVLKGKWKCENSVDGQMLNTKAVIYMSWNI